ncbi:MAG: anion transporter [Thermanaerothrix sp.]|nr:anion transporter [Thermanaerothrix sp.]
MEPSVLIFAVSYLILAVGQPPILRIDRTGAVIIGASLMVFVGAISTEDAYKSIDYRTLATLFGLMVLVAHFRLSGTVNLLSAWLLKRAGTPNGLLIFVITTAGALSALFVNDTICLLFTPMLLRLTYSMGTDPRPHLLALCMAANVGSASTITGNPQNLIIGLASGISYGKFFVNMLIPSAVGLILTYFVIRMSYREQLTAPTTHLRDDESFPYHKAMVIKFTILSTACLAGFFSGLPIEVVSMAIASCFLITRRVKPEKVYQMIDFKLLLLFIGLFVIMGGFQRSKAFAWLSSFSAVALTGSTSLSLISAGLSNLVSNVPAVMLLKPLVKAMDLGDRGWLILAMSSTFAGNLTVLGSIANIIVIEGASGRVRISSLEHLNVGLPVTIGSIAFGIWWLNNFYIR